MFEDQIRDGRVAALALPGATPLQGGIPIVIDGKVAGAIGVSGNTPQEDEEIAIDVGARSFLHNQVRILVGTLQLVGRGQWSRQDVEEALAAKDRTRAGPTAPPGGLCLMEVRYDPLPVGAGSSAGQRRDSEEAGDDE